MKILLVSQFFEPEPGATQNRMTAFVDGLTARGHDVTVVCEQPCHPAGVFHPGFGGRPLVTERRARRTVHRLWVAASPCKSAARRLAFYGTFAAGVTAAVRLVDRHDVLLATSPPLPGVLAAAAAMRRETPLVVDVRDIWPAAAEALGELSSRPVIGAFERAERWLYRRAYRVTATTRSFCTHIDDVAGRQVSVHLPNGALDELMALPDSDPPQNERFTLGYAGNIGITQGLRIALDAADRLRADRVQFVLVGEGPLREALRQEVADRGLDSVEFRAPIPVCEIGSFLQTCDALLVPLRDHQLFGGFIPSKLYDAMAIGRPAIVAARGEAAALVESTGAGIVVPPEDGAALAAATKELAAKPEWRRALGAAGRQAARKLTRSRQVDRLEEILLAATEHRRAAHQIAG